MNTLNDQAILQPSSEVKLQGQIKEILGDRVPVKTPEGGNVEPTLILNGCEYFEIDLKRLSDRQFVQLVNFYSNACDSLRAAFNQDAIALLPSDWVGGMA